MNHQGSYFLFFFFFFFFVFIQWVKRFCTPANFVTIWSTVLNNEKKYLYTTYVLVCQNCTLIFSRTRKQNWIIICQCCMHIWLAGRGVGVRGFKMFCQRGSEFFYLLCVCLGGGGQGQYLSFREKQQPPPINKWLVPITKSPKGHYVADLFLKILLVQDKFNTF